jgi:Lar family restriction alleviation protein
METSGFQKLMDKIMPNDSITTPLHGIVLLPCPFCGKQPRIERLVGSSSEPTCLKIVCRSCPLEFVEYLEKEKNSMAKAWNKRAGQ